MKTQSSRFLFTLTLALWFGVAASGQAEEKIRGLLHNEDCTDFFAHRPLPAGRCEETLDRYLDVLAGARISALFCNVNARRTNYRSDAWAAFWDGYDHNGPDDQPFFKPIPVENRQRWRMLVHNMWLTHHEGVDYPAHVINGCRERKISPWLSIRMNDVHFNGDLDHPFHDKLWRRPELFRKNHPGYFARALDYAHPEVRDHYRNLIAELLERYDPDGIELDFMREPYLFSAGEEQTGAATLTQWLGEVRKLLNAASKRRGHPVKLSVRVPSQPEIAASLGLDAPTWARQGLVDLVVACPRWQTLHFDIPLPRWRELLGDKVSLAGGLETRYQPAQDNYFRLVTPEDAAGAAMAVWSGGADAVYLFNYFQNSHPHWEPDVYRRTLRALGSLEGVSQLPRRHAVTRQTITLPGESYRPPLPPNGPTAAFNLPLGPRPPATWTGEVILAAGDHKPKVSVNGVGAVWSRAQDGLQIYSLPLQAVAGDGRDKIEIAASNGEAFRLTRVEIRFAPPE